MNAAVDELNRVLPLLVADARRRDPAAPAEPPGAPGWHAYSPVGGSGAPFVPPTPWAEVEVLGVGAAGQALMVSFRWLPTGRVFAYVTDLTEWDDPDLAALRVEHQIARMVTASGFPDGTRTMALGAVTLVTAE
jgi:hypothetical protein